MIIAFTVENYKALGVHKGGQLVEKEVQAGADCDAHLF